MQRVLMTADPVGGVWDYALELARGLSDLQISTVLAVMGGRRSDAQRAASEAVPGLLVEEGDFRLEWMRDADIDLIEAGRWLLALEETHRPDIVHLNNYAHATLPWRAPCLVVAHSCIASWWCAVKRSPLPRDLSSYTDMVAAALQGANAVVAPSQSLLAALQPLYGPLPGARVIHNGRSAAAFPALAKEPFVITAGRAWDEAKNIRALDEIAPALPWPIYLAGDCRGPDDAGWQPCNLTPLGRLPSDDLARWLGRAAIFALPAHYEPFGLTALEAALAGCALVLGDNPTMRELWEGAALFVPPDDRAQLAAAIHQLIRRPHLRDALGAAARARAHRYNAPAMTQAYRGLYQEIIADRRSPVGTRVGAPVGVGVGVGADAGTGVGSADIVTPALI
ncbi:glycosyltransferase family 4 protein [Rhodospirillaceae bacterium SYSU D60014]|uniref:glycosyltransferase family 4 protein n=1 Tax=Virgifigura deserti TaxID=2268457 RepID=UPI0013C51CC9